VSCFRFSAAEKANYPIPLLCRMLGVSRSGFTPGSDGRRQTGHSRMRGWSSGSGRFTARAVRRTAPAASTGRFATAASHRLSAQQRFAEPFATPERVAHDLAFDASPVRGVASCPLPVLAAGLGLEARKVLPGDSQAGFGRVGHGVVTCSPPALSG
jgi:hypothetical protein